MSQTFDDLYDDLQGSVDEDDNAILTPAQRQQKRKKLWTIIGIVVTIWIVATIAVVVLNPSGDDESTNDGAADDSITSGGGDTVFSGFTPDGGLPSVPEGLHTICAPLNLIQSPQAYDDCLHLCHPAECCHFSASSSASCLTEYRELCEQYRASCQHLQNQKAEEATYLETIIKVCSTQSLQTETGMVACKEQCDPYACCFDGSTDCTHSDAVCSDHGACVTALLLGDRPIESAEQAKGAVDTACGDLGTYEGQTKCSHICSPALCCFLSPSVWHKPCQVRCDHYETCSVLYGPIQQSNETEIRNITYSIPHELEKTCSPAQMNTLKGSKECLEGCQHHLCCFDDENPCNAEECHLYSACQVLVGRNSSTEITNSYVHEVCSGSIIETDGPKSCLDACSSSFCCLVDPRFTSWCGDNNPMCSKTEGCRIFSPTKLPPENPYILNRIGNVCTEGNLQSTLGATECETECSQRECCIDFGAANCQDTDLDYCDEVKPCQLLSEVDQIKETREEAKRENINAVAQNLERVCTPDNIATLSGYHTCYDDCYYHLCCFSDEPQCKEIQGSTECQKYAACGNLVNAGVSSSSSSSPIDVCSTESVSTPSGLQLCREVCAPRLCCFQDSNLPSSCVNSIGKAECSKFDACSVLVSVGSHNVYQKEDPYLVALVLNYCAEGKVGTEEGADRCRTQCMKRDCCFDELEGCYQTDKDWCDQFSSCSNLEDLKLGSGSIPVETNEILEDEDSSIASNSLDPGASFSPETSEALEDVEELIESNNVDPVASFSPETTEALEDVEELIESNNVEPDGSRR